MIELRGDDERPGQWYAKSSRRAKAHGIAGVTVNAEVVLGVRDKLPQASDGSS